MYNNINILIKCLTFYKNRKLFILRYTMYYGTLNSDTNEYIKD